MADKSDQSPVSLTQCTKYIYIYIPYLISGTMRYIISSKRQEVIDYVSRKYGSEKVVQIVTFGTLAAKGVIKDVGRALDLPYTYTDRISKMIPNELNITLDGALKLNAELRNEYESDEQLHYLIDICNIL